VIIPTFNRKNKLKKRLESLEKLDYPKCLLEIIVVDNGSVDGTSNMVSCEFDHAKLVVEPRQGVPFARNTGVLHSKGEIISFLDDDCQVEESWLRETVRNFSRKDIIGVGGPVIFRLNTTQIHQKFLNFLCTFPISI
jgi:glycosyltransferase involved in cell wall biosynthesis